MSTSLSASLCRYTRLQWLPAGCQHALAALLRYLSSSSLHVSMCLADRTIKSQGVPSTELSVNVIGWPLAIDGPWPTGQPPKSIQTAGKDEMALGMPAARGLSATHMQKHTPHQPLLLV